MKRAVAALRMMGRRIWRHLSLSWWSLSPVRRVNYLGESFRVQVYGRMSHRQYFAAREDEFIERVAQASWRKLAYIGASYGLAPLRLGVEGPVVGIEAIKCIADAFEQHAAWNPHSNVEVWHAALGPTSGELTFNHGGHGGATPAASGHGEIREVVECVSLQDQRLSDVDALVMDVEGFEKEIFLDGPPVPEAIRLIGLELHESFIGAEAAGWVLDELAAQGFEDLPLTSRGGQVHHILTR